MPFLCSLRRLTRSTVLSLTLQVAPRRPAAAAQHTVDDEEDDLVLSRLATKKQTFSISGGKQKTIPVTVVDEHMHVLPYWFDKGSQAAPLGATLVLSPTHCFRDLDSYYLTAFAT